MPNTSSPDETPTHRVRIKAATFWGDAPLGRYGMRPICENGEWSEGWWKRAGYRSWVRLERPPVRP